MSNQIKYSTYREVVAARAMSFQASHPFNCILCCSSMNKSLQTCAHKHAAGVIDTPHVYQLTDGDCFSKTVVTFPVTTPEYLRQDVSTFAAMFVATKPGISCHKHDLSLALT